MDNVLEKPHHINAEPSDLEGNNGIGRYILLPGSDGRAKQMSEFFSNVSIKEHPRGHNLYLGTLESDHGPIDVASISSGMGCASMEIILHELFYLGAKRFLRVGTAGSLQEKLIRIGDIVCAHASVRDEQTTLDYVPPEVPAIASTEVMLAIAQAAKNMGMDEKLHTGLVHCKSSFYAREFYAGPIADEHKDYMEMLVRYGVLASEMETAALFIQSQLYNYYLTQEGTGPKFTVLAGAILGIGAIPPNEFMDAKQEKDLTASIVKLSIETLKVLAASESP